MPPKARIGLPRTRPGYASPRLRGRAGPTKPEPKRISPSMIGLCAVVAVCLTWFAVDRFGRHGPEDQGSAAGRQIEKQEIRRKAAPKPSASPMAGGFLVG